MQDITTHIMHHMVEGIQKYGPVYGTWMYPFERFNRSVCFMDMPTEHVQRNDNTFFSQLDDKTGIKPLSPRSHYH